MPIVFGCVSCSIKLQVAENLIGRKFNCPKCGEEMLVSAQPSGSMHTAGSERPPTPGAGHHSSTSLTLLHRLQADDPAGWQRLIDLYGPLIYFWCRRWPQLNHEDVADVFQEVLTTVA